MRSKIAFVISLMLASPGMAFTTFGYEGFAANPVVFNYNFSECPQPLNEMLAALETVIANWNDIPGSSLRVRLGTSVTVTEADYLAGFDFDAFRNPVVYCNSDSSTYDGGGIPPPGWGRLGLEGSRHAGGMAILNVDTSTAGGLRLINEGGVLLRGVMAHEMGHVLGLDHSNILQALMYSGGLVLSQDDWDGIRYLYPVEENMDTMFGCTRANAGSGSSKKSFPIDLIFVVIAFVFGRRLFRRLLA